MHFLWEVVTFTCKKIQNAFKVRILHIWEPLMADLNIFSKYFQITFYSTFEHLLGIKIWFTGSEIYQTQIFLELQNFKILLGSEVWFMCYIYFASLKFLNVKLGIPHIHICYRSEYNFR